MKQGPITNFDAPWRSVRHDHPCALVTEDGISLFYRGISRAEDFNPRVVGLARSGNGTPDGPYEFLRDPVLSVPGGGETPRVFRVGETWHIFYLQYTSPAQKKGRVYAHYQANDPTRWTLVSASVYESGSVPPGVGAADMCPIWTPFEEGPPWGRPDCMRTHSFFSPPITVSFTVTIVPCPKPAFMNPPATSRWCCACRNRGRTATTERRTAPSSTCATSSRPWSPRRAVLHPRKPTAWT